MCFNKQNKEAKKNETCWVDRPHTNIYLWSRNLCKCFLRAGIEAAGSPNGSSKCRLWQIARMRPINSSFTLRSSSSRILSALMLLLPAMRASAAAARWVALLPAPLPLPVNDGDWPADDGP